ncbi:tRNA-guanine(15) transglycosylase-like protein [Baffinella frigidus]|nr:tRNA-guanine(15) transglycosylase-like protein [Cryptophyta sp. CCMP2293]
MQLPADRPNHLLGIADIGSIDKCVPHGVDTFDSAFPSRNGRHGSLLTHEGTVKIGNAKYANMHEPISAYFPHYTAAYLHHLHKAKEPLSGVIFTMHNLCFMQDHMREVRRKIMNNEI